MAGTTDGGRYRKQELFGPVGAAGQDRIGRATVAVLGCGALGSAAADLLTRAGVGRLRLIDRDFVELENLQRQRLYDEDQARRRLPKAVAAAERLRQINSRVELDPHVADVNPDTVEELIRHCAAVLDGADNMETRFLLNDAAVRHEVPWFYGAAVGSRGMTMPVVPGSGPCLRCLLDRMPAPGSLDTCETAGVLNAVTSAVASLQVAGALRLLSRPDEPPSGLVTLDVWEGRFERLQVSRRADCPTCARREFEYLDGPAFSSTARLCGRDMVQILPAEEKELSLERLCSSLSGSFETSCNGYLLTVRVDGREVVIFPTGRALVKGTGDETEARRLYARCVAT